MTPSQSLITRSADHWRQSRLRDSEHTREYMAGITGTVSSARCGTRGRTSLGSMARHQRKSRCELFGGLRRPGPGVAWWAVWLKREQQLGSPVVAPTAALRCEAAASTMGARRASSSSPPRATDGGVAAWQGHRRQWMLSHRRRVQPRYTGHLCFADCFGLCASLLFNLPCLAHPHLIRPAFSYLLHSQCSQPPPPPGPPCPPK